MNKKELFVEAFKATVGKSPEEYHKSKDYKGFAEVVNANPQLAPMFRDAVADCSAEDGAAAGLGSLFSTL